MVIPEQYHLDAESNEVAQTYNFPFQCPVPSVITIQGGPNDQLEKSNKLKKKVQSRSSKQTEEPPKIENQIPKVDNTTDEKKKLFNQTLTGFIIRLFEAHKKISLNEAYIVECVRANVKNLKRNDGSKYKGNLYKTVKGSLTSNGIFKKDDIIENENFWCMKQQQADEYERRTTLRIYNQIDKKKIIKKRDDQVEPPIHKYSHAFRLLNGFIDSLKLFPTVHKLVTDAQEQNEQLIVENLKNHFKSELNLENLMQGMKKCRLFFKDILPRRET
ncbi:hypothetical protein pb186bvf_020212 [Paramecium bursaria]